MRNIWNRIINKSKDIEIRQASPKDVFAISQLVKDIKTEYAVQVENVDEKQMLLDLHKITENKTFLVALDNEQIVACMSISINENKTASLHHWYVSKDYRRMGIGKVLLSMAIQFAKMNSSEKLDIKAHRRFTKAHKIFDKYGFKAKAASLKESAKHMSYVFKLA